MNSQSEEVKKISKQINCWLSARHGVTYAGILARDMVDEVIIPWHTAQLSDLKKKCDKFESLAFDNAMTFPELEIIMKARIEEYANHERELKKKCEEKERELNRLRSIVVKEIRKPIIAIISKRVKDVSLSTETTFHGNCKEIIKDLTEAIHALYNKKKE